MLVKVVPLGRDPKFISCNRDDKLIKLKEKIHQVYGIEVRRQRLYDGLGEPNGCYQKYQYLYDNDKTLWNDYYLDHGSVVGLVEMYP